MKTKLFSILAASALAFASCSDDNPAPIVKGDQELKGEVAKDTKVTLDANITYTLTGSYYVRSGATLEIPAGTVIKAKDGGTGIFLFVERGGKLIADGTAAKPIVFTSSSATPKEGDWGGIIINGKAPISGPAGVVAESPSEMDTGQKYGGSDANDNSGVLNFVKIEYTGARIDAEKEHNGLTLNAVGKGTKISNIYFRYAGDDAIEFFGGSVDVSNLLVVNGSDDFFDFTEGYRGTVTNVYGIREKSYLDATSDPSAIEADGNRDGKGADHINQSDFKVDGITVINLAPNTKDQNGKDASTMLNVFKIRRNAKANISNALIKFGPGTVPGNLFDLTGSNAGTTISYTIDPANGLDKAPILNPVNVKLTPGASNTGANTSAFAWTGYKFQ